MTILSLTKTPHPSSHWKYLVPATLPSFLPPGASSSTPTHLPGAKAVCPTKRTCPRPAETRTRAPRGMTKGEADMGGQCGEESEESEERESQARGREGVRELW